MKTVNTIKNFLYSKDYFINLFENNIHIYNFEELVNISDVLIELRFARFNVKVYGQIRVLMCGIDCSSHIEINICSFFKKKSADK